MIIIDVDNRRWFCRKKKNSISVKIKEICSLQIHHILIERFRRNYNYHLNIFYKSFRFVVALNLPLIKVRNVRRSNKISLISLYEEVYLLKYHFESHLINKWHYYRPIIFNQLNIMKPYIGIISIYAIVSKFCE